MKHDRIYALLLASLALMAILCSGLLSCLAGAGAGSALHTRLPGWSLPWVAAVNSAYAIAIVVVLCARRFKPHSGRKLTRPLNWALLLALPAGTIVGLYGILSVDKEGSSDQPSKIS
ncbi:MAG: hypothetical protein ABSE48_18060 [Verrucomicrobiota bacterium]